MEYTSLEPNHTVLPEEEGLLTVLCPFEQLPDGELVLHEIPLTPTATWSKDADLDEVECPVCEVFNGKLWYAGSPDCTGEGG